MRNKARSAFTVLLLLLVTIASTVQAEGGTTTTTPSTAPATSTTSTQGQPTVSSVYVPDEDDVSIEMLLQTGDTEEVRLAGAVAKLEATVTSDATDFESLVKLGLAYKMQGKYDKAVTALNNAARVQLSAGEVQILIMNVMAAAAAAAPSTSTSSATVAVSVPDEVDTRIDALLEPGDTSDQRLNSLITKMGAKAKADLNDFASRMEAAIALSLQGKKVEARPYLEEAMALHPEVKDVGTLLAWSLSAADPGRKVYVNGKLARFDVPPVIVNGRTLLPLRGVAEQLGAQVDWNAATLTATVTLGPNTVQVTRDSAKALVNGLEVALDVPATIIDGRTMLPLRFMSEALNKTVDYYPGDPGTAVIVVRNK